MPANWKSAIAAGEQTLGLYYFMYDGVGASSGQMGVANNCFGSQFEQFCSRGPANPVTTPAALDNCINRHGYDCVMWGWWLGGSTNEDRYPIGTVAPGHPDEGDTITCQPWDELQFNSGASENGHVAAFRASMLARASKLRRIHLYQGAPHRDQSITTAALDASMETAIALNATLAIDANGECSRENAFLPVVKLVDRAALHGVPIVSEAWGRTDTPACSEWLARSIGMAATGASGYETGEFRADLAWNNVGGVWQSPNVINAAGRSPIVIIAYNGLDADVRLQYVKDWLDRGCSPYYDPLGFDDDQLADAMDHFRFLNNRTGSFGGGGVRNVRPPSAAPTQTTAAAGKPAYTYAVREPAGGGTIDTAIDNLVGEVGAAVQKAAVDLLGDIPVRSVNIGGQVQVGSDDPQSLVREYGTENTEPQPWGAQALDAAADQLGGAWDAERES